MLEDYIKSNWKNTIRYTPDDDGTLIGLPYPYTVPGMGDEFPEMYYWDTYFTNKGLLLSGMEEQVKNNTCDMLYLVNKYGYVPNGNRTFYLTRSQPPFLSMMVYDVYKSYGDKEWLKNAYNTLKIEYDFWTNERKTETGLNQYGGRTNAKEAKRHADRYRRRVGLPMDDVDDEKLWKHYIAFCESGWDINPRWDFESYNFIQPELNSLLYIMEENMRYFSSECGMGEEEKWKELSKTRKQLMNKYMVDENGIFLDYNFKKNELGKIISAASFYPLFANIATKEQAKATESLLEDLESDYGIITSKKNETVGNYQWDYPNGWPPLQYIVIKGLENYGYKNEALRIAKKYSELVERVFEETNNLWEKYNMVKGNIEVTNEYKMPPMMGWTAGVYLFCKDYVSKHEKSV